MQDDCETRRSVWPGVPEKVTSNVLGKHKSSVACRIHQPGEAAQKFAISKRHISRLQGGMDQLSQAVGTREGGKHLLQQLEDLDLPPAKKAKLAEAVFQVIHPAPTAGA